MSTTTTGYQETLDVDLAPGGAAPNSWKASTPTTSTPGSSASITGPRPVADDHGPPLPVGRRVDRDARRGRCPKDHGLTLDSIATAHFRGFYGQNSVCYFPEIHDCFYNLALPVDRQGVLGRRVRQADDDAVQHLRAAPLGPQPPSRRARPSGACAYENTPVWLQNIMAKLRSVHRLPGEDGPDHHVVVGGRERHLHLLARRTARRTQPARAPAVEHGARRAERADVPPGRPRRAARRARHPRPRPPVDVRVPARTRTTGSITTDGVVIRRYGPDEIRFLVHWNAEVYCGPGRSDDGHGPHRRPHPRAS